MIPRFPKFKPLDISDRGEVIKHTSRFVPYSDFNFTSLWSWNTDDEFLISSLNGNLVIRFLDYITKTPFLSFMGNSQTEETIQLLIDYSKANEMDLSLRLVPEESLNGFEKEKSKFCIEEDRENFDYMLTIEKLINYKGNKLRGKRNFTTRFQKLYKPISLEIDIHDPRVQAEVLAVVGGWSNEKKSEGADINLNEVKAIERVLQSELPDVLSVGVYLNGSMVGFIIGEILISGYAVLHFEKAISRQYTGIYAYMMQRFAQVLAKKGCEFINYEQDLGIPGLRKSKESFQPIMVKKYIIKEKV